MLQCRTNADHVLIVAARRLYRRLVRELKHVGGESVGEWLTAVGYFPD